MRSGIRSVGSALAPTYIEASNALHREERVALVALQTFPIPQTRRVRDNAPYLFRRLSR
jgi:hypothetical protein